jgi:O-antigen/teichoic acid export membrane protein
LIKQFVIQITKYASSGLIEKILPLALLPIISRYYGIEGVGQYILFSALLEVSYIFLTLGLESVVSIYYRQKSRARYETVIMNTIILQSIYNFIVLVSLVPFISYISHYIGLSRGIAIFILIIPIFRFAFATYINICQLKFQLYQYVKWSITLSILKSAVPIVLVVSNWITNIDGVLYIIGISYILVGLAAYIPLYRSLFYQRLYRINKNRMTKVVRHGLYTLVHLSSSQISGPGAKVIIGLILGSSAVGELGIIMTYGSIILMAEEVINRAFYPNLFTLLKVSYQENRDQIIRYSVVFYIMIIVVSLMVYLIAIYTTEILFGSGLKYSEQYGLVVLLAFMFKGLYKVHVNYFFYYEKTDQLSMISLISSVIGVATIIFASKLYGLQGASYGILMMVFIQYIATIIYSNRLIYNNS